jgi:hypothetical protein
MLRARALLLPLLLFSVTAAAQSSVADGFAKLPSGARVVLMPVDVELYELSGGGVLEPRADWTSAATRHIRSSLLKSNLGVLELSGEPDEAVERIVRLHRAVSSAVVIHHQGSLKLPTKAGRLDWSLGPEAALLGSRSGAEYALFVWLRDSYASTERKAAMAVAALAGFGISGAAQLGYAALVGMGLNSGAQVGYASLVDLSSGRIVWFNGVSRRSGDLREETAAQETLDALLADLPR